MYIIYKFEDVINVTRFDDIEYDDGHICLSNDSVDIISTNTISYEQFTYIAWSLYHNLKHDLSNYNFIVNEG